jgi:aminopeptidase
MDPRYEKLADVLLGHSVKLKRDQKVLIDAFDCPRDMVLALVEGARKRRAHPLVNLHDAQITRALLIGGKEAQFKAHAGWQLNQMKKVDAYVAVRGSHNIFEASDVPAKNMSLFMKYYKPVLDYRVKQTNWVVLRWPTPAMAQQALKSTAEFEDFFFKVCTLDYKRMVPGMNALKRLMDQTDQVRIVGPGETDLSFSIKGIDTITCGGDRNIPDGETFTAPIKDSVEGVLQYNIPSVYQGVSFDQIRFVFEKGKIVEATSSNTRRMNQILDSDPGARYIGEFSLGFNPYVLEGMRDTLFDEKMAGSFHFTPGQAYEIADNGNKSQVHWDIVCCQRKEYGGGEVYFDGKLIRKDGRFLPAALQKLNPDYLLGKTPAKKKKQGTGSKTKP